jgi:5-oxopent-3-ene-1,2,5-tricarboxylate decarboxylase/2-hydroxyhepta-2,4-diene-1,7-dioate isomerase
MKHARIAYDGAIHRVTAVPGDDTRVQLADGRVLHETEVVWLPPVEPRTIFALGLSYADHAKELAFKARS